MKLFRLLILIAAASGLCIAQGNWQLVRTYRGSGPPGGNLCSQANDVGLVYTNRNSNGHTYVCHVVGSHYEWQDLYSLAGVAAFLDLTDTPSAYTGEAGKVPAVNVGETGLEFISASGVGTMTSAAISVPATMFSVSGSPITDAGTFTLSYATGQTANYVFGTDASGNVGLMAMTADQVPDLSGTYLPLHAKADTAGTADALADQYTDWDASSGGASIANKPSLGTAAGATLVTSVGSPGSDTNIPSEAAVRSAIAAGSGDVVADTLTTENAIPVVGSTAKHIGESTCTIVSGVLTCPGGTSTGTTPPTVSGGTSGLFALGEGTAPTSGPASAVDICYADSTANWPLCNFNNFDSGTYHPMVVGPTSSTDVHLAEFSGTGGGLLADSGIATADVMTTSTSVASSQLPFPGATDKGSILTTACSAGYAAKGYKTNGTPDCVSVGGGSASLIADCTFDGGGTFITTNAICYKRATADATIVGWYIEAVGSSPAITIDVLKVAAGTALPTSSITSAATPALTSTDNAGGSETLTGWTTSVTKGDIIGFKVTTPGAATWAHISIYQ